VVGGSSVGVTGTVPQVLNVKVKVIVAGGGQVVVNVVAGENNS